MDAGHTLIDVCERPQGSPVKAEAARADPIHRWWCWGLRGEMGPPLPSPGCSPDCSPAPLPPLLSVAVPLPAFFTYKIIGIYGGFTHRSQFWDELRRVPFSRQLTGQELLLSSV